MEEEGTLKKIGFYELNSFSNINNSIRDELSRVFSEHEIITIDIFSEVKNNYLIMIFNFLNIIWEYFLDLLTGKKTITGCFTRNSFMFEVIRKIAAREASLHNFEFTIQTQSIFDASCPGIPHFVFTDNTILANLTNHLFDRNQLPSKKWMDKERQIYRNAVIVFVMSSNVSLSLQRDYNLNAAKIKLVYAGGNINLNGAADRERNYESKNILFVGGNWIRKGGPLLVEAFKRILQKHPDATLNIISRKAPLLNIPNCKVYGKLDLKEVGEFFEQASIFCLPTLVEPFGIVFLEAMMYKLPVIATKISAVPDFIIDGENGYKIEQNNIDQLENALLDLLSSSEKRKAFGMRSYEIYQEKYSWQRVAHRIKNHITESLSSDTGGLYYQLKNPGSIIPSEALN